MASRNFLTKAAALLALCTGLLAPALAQRSNDTPDAGDFQILQARYGTPERNVDVTARLKELARQDQKFRMGNDIFGVDPHPDRVKSLRIFARGRDGEIRTFEYAEGSMVDGAQFTGWAGGGWGQGGWNDNWGGRDAHRVQQARQLGEAGEGEWVIEQARYGTGSRDIDVTDKLKQLARKERSLRAGNDIFGADPAINEVKTLRITARNAEGKTRSFEYAENGLVDGSQFKGWSRGDWGTAAKELKILSASYGTDSSKRDVAEALRKRIREGKLELQVENAALDGRDPAPGELKALWVSYTIGAGKAQQARIAEHGWLRLP